jgi:PAS domain S-box-containing protein
LRTQKIERRMQTAEENIIEKKNILLNESNAKLSDMFNELEQINWQYTFFSIIEHADANILLLDAESKVVSLNPGFYWIFLETYGIALKPGASIIDAIKTVNPELSTKWKERCNSVLKGNSLRLEDMYEMEGRKYYWEVNYKKVMHEEASYISVFSRDVTARKALQQRTASNEANLRSILNSIDDGVWLINDQYELIDFNREFFQKYQAIVNIKPVKGKSVLDLFPTDKPSLVEIWKTRYETGLRGKVAKYTDTYLVNGERKIYEVKVYPIRGEGKVTGLTMLARDITKIKEAEEQLTMQNDELTKINSELDRFVYSASHDLRAPLLSVKGLLNMIKLDDSKENTEKYLELIAKSINKLDRFITDIVHHSRNSRMDVLPKEIDFNSLINDSIDSLKYMDDAEKVRSVINIDATHKFYSDASRLMIIFNNIISNAVSYRDKDKESFIQVDVYVSPDKATLRFTDNGIGIAPEFQEKIFKMFFRATPDSKGSGLGLYIVKGVLDKLKGTIAVKSFLGEGTEITIELPSLEPAFYLQNLN